MRRSAASLPGVGALLRILSASLVRMPAAVAASMRGAVTSTPLELIITPVMRESASLWKMYLAFVMAPTNSVAL
jgi:hypothetical protein